MAVDIVNSIFDCRTWVSAFIALATSRSLAANNFTVIQLFLLYLAGTLSVVRRALRVFSSASSQAGVYSLSLGPRRSPFTLYKLFNFTSNRLSTRYRVPARVSFIAAS